jgi:dihydroorotate dehydrogenase electron transfer subunit
MSRPATTSAPPGAGEAARRRIAPFGRRRTQVTQSRDIGAYRLFACRDADGPPPRPGQFYMLSAVERWGGGEAEWPFLPRAFSYLRRVGDELQFLLEDVGPGTRRLAQLAPGEELWVVGPLGMGFWAPEPGRVPLLVGGGIGIVPLACWQDELGAPARPLLGFRDAAHAVASELLAEAVVATDDGSTGRRGLATDLLAAELRSIPEPAVYACGPPAMLEAVRALAAEHRVPAQLAMESGMACGFGACFGCVVPTRHGHLRLCVDGPVVDACDLDTALIPGTGH